MSSKTMVTLVDDVDGQEADETVRFSLDGVDYEIDLGNENADALRDEFKRWITHGRRVGGRHTQPTRHQKQAAATPPSPAAATSRADTSTMIFTKAQRDAMRAWGATRGYPPAQRGRIPESLKQEWVAAGQPGM